MNTKLQNHAGKFISLSFKDGKKIKKVCAKVINLTPCMVTFQNVNNFEITTKKISSLV